MDISLEDFNALSAERSSRDVKIAQLEMEKTSERMQYQRELDAYKAEREALWKENQELRDHHHKGMEELRKLSETEAGLIREKEIDRKALSSVAGKIGKITRREVNVR